MSVVAKCMCDVMASREHTATVRKIETLNTDVSRLTAGQTLRYEKRRQARVACQRFTPLLPGIAINVHSQQAILIPLSIDPSLSGVQSIAPFSLRNHLRRASRRDIRVPLTPGYWLFASPFKGVWGGKNGKPMCFCCSSPPPPHCATAFLLCCVLCCSD